ncbi:hypothetical protein T492DRAFT_1106833 [Pavlovales sp. CCMP2436]|nr:hypothetical protein T492DRAFT_1106833 [Pavlovales sp. CCMP2436]
MDIAAPLADEVSSTPLPLPRTKTSSRWLRAASALRQATGGRAMIPLSALDAELLRRRPAEDAWRPCDAARMTWWRDSC